MAMAQAFRGRVLQAARLLRRNILPEDKSFGSAASPRRALSLLSSKAFISFSVERHRLAATNSTIVLQSRNFSAKGKKKGKSDSSEASGDDKLSEKEAALQAALSQIGSTFGKETVMWLGRFLGHRNVPVISTGSLNLDVALGIGGLPKGRMVEIYGPEASGKTTLGLHTIAEAQRNGGHCLFVDAEHALDRSLAEAIGVNTKNLLISQPDCGEQALSLVDTFIRSGSLDVIVVDSVAALVPKSELEGEMGDAHMAVQARLMSQALRKLTPSLCRSQTLLIFINQVRSKLSSFGGFGGPSEVTAGGNALKFYASIRLNIRRTGLLKRGDETFGSQILVKVVKNKLAPPFKTAEFEIEFGRGISCEAEILDLGCTHDVITKSGNFYRLNGENFNGKEKAKKYLRENDQIRYELMSKLKQKLLGGIVQEDDLEKDLGDTSSENNDEIIETEAVAEAVAEAV